MRKWLLHIEEKYWVMKENDDCELNIGLGASEKYY